MSNLISAEGLTLPQKIGGSLSLRGLTSAEGLTLPQSIGRWFDLSSLTSAEGLKITDTLNCKLYCSIAKDIDELREICKKNIRRK